MAVAVRTLDNFIGGEWRPPSGERFRELVSPVTGEVLAEVGDAGRADIDAAVAAARSAQPKWAALSAWERAKVCHAIADLIDERREAFAHALSLEQGKPYLGEALPDIDETAENFRIAAEDVKRMETAVIPSQDVNKRILTFRKPNGVYAAITPWNFPTLIPVELIAPGIAAGNTIVMKPSEWTPLAMANFMQIMADAGLPDGVVNVLYGGGDVGESLVTHPGIDCIGFVGSHGTAEKIVRAAGLKRSLIEASGNGPVIVCEDADLARAAEGAVFGGFFCAGQVCCATERVLVNERVHDAFLDEVVKAAAQWKLGDPFDADTKVGPMNNEPTARKMDAHLEDAVSKGATIVAGGSREDGRPTDLYYQPTVVVGRRQRHPHQSRRDVRADRAADSCVVGRRGTRGRKRLASGAPGCGVHIEPVARVPVPRQPSRRQRRGERLDRLLGGARAVWRSCGNEVGLGSDRRPLHDARHDRPEDDRPRCRRARLTSGAEGWTG